MFISLSFCTATTLANTISAKTYGRNWIEEEKFDSSVCDVNFKGEDTGKQVSVVYNGNKGAFISLQDFAEAVGGSYTPSRKYDYFGTNMGEFEIFGKKFVMETRNTLGKDEELKSVFMNMYVYTYEDNKKILLQFNSYTMDGTFLFVDNIPYFCTDYYRTILPRIGYLVNLDIEGKTLNIKKYNFEEEKKMMLRRFSSKKFDTGVVCNLYAEEYKQKYEKFDSIIVNRKHPVRIGGLCEYSDFFVKQDALTRNTKALAWKYVSDFHDNYYLGIIDTSEDYYKDMFKVAYRDADIDNKDITVEYDSALDAYIIYNKDYKEADSLDRSYKILVVRGFDGMTLYKLTYLYSFDTDN
jgi:hypothetical protein